MVLVNDARYEDVVAEVFVGLWFFPQRFDPTRGSLLAFLRLKARGHSIDIVRNEAARRRREQKERATLEVGATDAASEVLVSERAVAVRDAIAQLPQSEREPIRLAFFAGMTYAAAAIELGLPEGTVKSRIRSGLNRLRNDDGMRLQLSDVNRGDEVTPDEVPVALARNDDIAGDPL
jgi:RNA polymerase sigma-70 factor (ECF subfamily)